MTRREAGACWHAAAARAAYVAPKTHSPDLGVANLGDPPKAVLSTGGVLSRHQAEPGGEVARDSNRLISPTVAAISDATFGPKPGMVASRRDTSLIRA